MLEKKLDLRNVSGPDFDDILDTDNSRITPIPLVARVLQLRHTQRDTGSYHFDQRADYQNDKLQNWQLRVYSNYEFVINPSSDDNSFISKEITYIDWDNKVSSARMHVIDSSFEFLVKIVEKDKTTKYLVDSIKYKDWKGTDWEMKVDLTGI